MNTDEDHGVEFALLRANNSLLLGASLRSGVVVKRPRKKEPKTQLERLLGIPTLLAFLLLFWLSSLTLPVELRVATSIFGFSLCIFVAAAIIVSVRRYRAEGDEQTNGSLYSSFEPDGSGTRPATQDEPDPRDPHAALIMLRVASGIGFSATLLMIAAGYRGTTPSDVVLILGWGGLILAVVLFIGSVLRLATLGRHR